MDFDEDMSGLQIEDLGEYFLQTDINDNWKGFSLTYTDEDQQKQQQQQQNSQQAAGAHASESSSSSAAASGSSSMQHLTSPPLSSISEMLKHGNGLGVGLGFGSPRKDFTSLFQTGLTPASAKPDAAMMNRTARDAMELASFSLDQHKKPAALAIPAKLGSSIKPAAPKLPSPPCQNIMSSDDDDMSSFSSAQTFKRYEPAFYEQFCSNAFSYGLSVHLTS
ncbi:unnamed protein product [Phytophthora lilii]|uniref:Unnamed protein product n=1 Tax=Phytophthora lilii TaxID=2077276 RepID=A0A9W6YE23_9STRA|nr:unnamed protein product [Phytophthora lilii]